MNIAKALKEKNRLIKDIKTHIQRATQNNSVLIENSESKSYSSKDELKSAEEAVKELVELKAKIQKANEPVQSDIFRLSELKSFVSQIKHMDVSNGIVRQSGYGSTGEPYEKKAEITEVELDSIVKGYEKEIEEIQEKLDKFNYTTEI